ncbi:MAG: DUF2169 domain-containing protein [Polyangiaceae bacterium]|nr:DUF2169 domain-containing protein [Polyangiaceae bacterium]
MLTRPIAKSVPGTPAGIEVRSHAPFTVGVVLWRDESARVLATVVAKATYKLTQGTSEIVDQPDPIRHPDEYWDDGAAGSLRFPSDLAPFKADHEVVVVGHVYSNGNHPTHTATARIVIGEIEKMITATAPRRSDRTGLLQTGAPQTRFSLRYEFAAGGVDNPVGIDPTDFTPDGGHVLPQLTPPNADVRPGDYVPSVGLGPVSRSWSARDSLLRPEDRDWLADPLRRPRPQGFDPRYFCDAPADQRSAEPLRADARLILEGLHPTSPRLVTNLSGVAPSLRALKPNWPAPPFIPDTLYIDTDRQIATLAFRAIVPLDNDKLVLDVVMDGYADQTVALDAAGGEATAELDRSAFSDVASSGLPFPPSSEPGRAVMQNAADGALPFRPPSHYPPPAPSMSSPPALPLAPPPSVPSPRAPAPSAHPPPAPPPAAPAPAPPPLVSAPPKESFVEPAPASANPMSTLGQLQSLLRTRATTDERRAEVQAPRSPEAAARPEAKDKFRKAFSFGSDAGPPKAAPSNPPPPPPPSSGGTKLADMALASGVVKASSDAAATIMATTPTLAGMPMVTEPRVAPTSTASQIERSPGIARRAIVDLLAFDAGVPNRLRRSKTHAPLLTELAGSRTPKNLDDKAGEKDEEDRARLDVLRVLSCGTPLGADELHATFDALLEDPQDFEIPLFLVEGEARPTMDEVETLKVALELAKPLAGTNKRVLGAIASASDALSRTAPPVPEVAAALYKQLDAATTELSLPTRHLSSQVDRTLLDARSYKKRTLLGSPRIRADLTLGRHTMPVYLPDAAASQLPLLPVFPLLALVEFRPREDASEQNPAALVAFALGRVLRSRK